MLRQLRRKFVIITMALAGTVLVSMLGFTLWSSRRAQRDLIAEQLSRAQTLDLTGRRSLRSLIDGDVAETLEFRVDDKLSELIARYPVLKGWLAYKVDWAKHGFLGSSEGQEMLVLRVDQLLRELLEDYPALKGELSEALDIAGGDEDKLPPDGGRDSSLTRSYDVSEDGAVRDVQTGEQLSASELPESVLQAVLATSEETGYDGGSHLAWRVRSVDEETKRVFVTDTSSMDTEFAAQIRMDLYICAGSLVALFAAVWWLSGWALRPVARAWDEQRRFVADASHELKTPLSVIIANTQILEGDSGLDPESRRWVDSTAEEAEHMKSLVNDLLELARADESAAGGAAGALHMGEVDLSELVDSSVLEFDAIAFERGCTLNSEVASGISVSGDAEWLSRVVRILIDNACKYAEKGSTVHVRLRRDGGRAVLSVNNRGGVIGPEDLPHVFERFYRSDRARTRGEGGFGLGLAIARSIVEAHGGRIGCTSDECEGTTFVIALPIFAR